MKITGQLMTQPCSKNETTDGRVLVAVFGVIAVPKGSELDITHRQFVVSGDADLSGLHTSLTIHHTETIDHPECLGMGVTGILTSPIWRY